MESQLLHGDSEKGSPFSLSIYRLLAQYAETNNNTFLLEGNPISSHIIYSPEMLLPVVALEAMRIWQTMERPANSVEPMGIQVDESLGVTFIESESSFFPLAAYTPPLTQNLASSMRLLCFNLANRRVFALKEGEAIDLAPFLDAWKDIDWYSEAINDLPVHKDFNAAFMQNEFTEKRVVPHGVKPKSLSPFSSKKDTD